MPTRDGPGGSPPITRPSGSGRGFIAAMCLLAFMALGSFGMMVSAQTAPPIIDGKVPTAAQWRLWFQQKQDFSGYTAVNKAGDIMLGKLRFTGAAPTLSSCGTSPSIVGNDQAGTVTTGTGTPASCTLSFTVAYPATPACQVQWRTKLATMNYSTSTAGITFTQTATNSTVIDYFCAGLQ